MRKVIAVFAAVVLMLGCIACSKNEAPTTPAAPATTAATTAAPETTKAPETTAAPETTTAAPETTTAPAEMHNVTISVANAGELVVTAKELMVKDMDDDGAVTVNDAFIAIHEEEFEGGAAAGYATADSGYGPAITKLWGVENGGSYGYYINNAMAMSLADPIADGDSIYVYAFKDTATFADAYCYFEPAVIGQGDNELTLMYMVFDANWTPVPTPLEGATIVINGVATDMKTDAEGKVTVPVLFDETDRLVISAQAEDVIITPPVCIAAK